MFMVNHDILSKEDNTNMKCLGDLVKPIIIDKKLSIIGINGIKSSKHSYPSHDCMYEKTAKEKLRYNPTILVTHEAPLVSDNKMNSQKIGNRDLMDLVKKFKPKIHFFGHCYFAKAVCFFGRHIIC